MGLRAFVIRRLLLLIPTLMGASLLIFAVSQLFDPISRAALYITNVQQFKPEVIESVIKTYGLNDPAYLQFFRWFKQVLAGNLGYSRTGHGPVLEVLVQRFPATAEIVMFAAPLIIFIGIWLGVKSAVHRDTPIDHATRTLAIIGYSLPSFWLGIILVEIFYTGLHLFPTGRLGTDAYIYVTTSPQFIRYTGLNTVDGILNGQTWITIDALQHLVLPVTVIVTISIALIIRIMRSSMLEALNKGYITMAKSKGLSEKEVINKHARKNALIPTITLSGLLVAGMLNGLVITETIFGYDGIGAWSARAAGAGTGTVDSAGILGFTLFSGFIFVAANLLVDVLYAYIDPRIRLE